MARTSAGRRGSTVIRTYAAAERASAEASFLRERDEAERRGWQPISQRWRSEGREQVLTVVFETRAADPLMGADAPLDARPPLGAEDAADPSTAPEVIPRPARPATRAVPGPVRAIPWDLEAAAARDAARQVVETLDLHAGGQPLRLIRSGYPAVPHLPIEERRTWVREHADHVRCRLLMEPRGHRDMTGAVLLPPWRDDADIAVLFMDAAGYTPMCGHGIIALTHGLIEEGLYPATAPFTLIRWETPVGLVTATAEVEVGAAGEPMVQNVRFVDVPAYLHADRLLMRPRGVRLFGIAAERKALGVLLAWGGAYYGIVDVAELGLRVVPEQVEALARVGAAVTTELRIDHAPRHPTDPALEGIEGTVIVDSDPATSPDGRAAGATMRTVTIMADGEVDRSPGGSGTSALLAARHALAASDVGDTIVHAGITGESFVGRIEGRTRLGDREAIVTTIAGRGFVTGRHRFLVDPRDPLGEGFLLR